MIWKSRSNTTFVWLERMRVSIWTFWFCYRFDIRMELTQNDFKVYRKHQLFSVIQQHIIVNSCWNIEFLLFHFVWFIFIFLVIGNVSKTKICLNLVKSFCGSGAQYDRIEEKINQIKPSPTILKIDGKKNE